MKIYILAILPLFQFLYSCNQLVEVPKASQLVDSQKSHKTDATETVNIVFKSADGGQTWQDISNGLPEPEQDNYGFGRNVFFTNDSGIYITDGNGIYHSEPNSKAPFWTKAFFPDEHASISPGKNGIFAYNYLSGILQKTNGTDVWSPVFTNFPEKQVRSVLETDGGTIFISSDKGLFKSTNGGKTWKLLLAGGLGGKMVESNGVLLSTGAQGIMRSTDEGENWSWVIRDGGVGIDVAPIEGGFAAINYSTVARTRRIRTSYDGGKTWQPIDAGFPGQTIIDSPWRLINAGFSAQGSDSIWHPKEADFQAPEYKTSIIQVGESFFCGHTDGIYKTSDKGKTWKLVLTSEKGKMFKLSVSGNVIYAIQSESHC
jgi:photosystem II stability/assembly factor-like uncharacterized protein